MRKQIEIKDYINSIYYKNTLVPEKDLYAEKGRMGEYLTTCALTELANNNGLVGYIYNNILLDLPYGSVS